MNERVGVGFETFATIEGVLIGTAVLAPVSHPCVLRALEPDVAVITVEALGDRVLALGVLRAINTAPRQQAGEMRDADAEHLISQNVINTLFEVRNLGRQSSREAAGDLAQEHTRLRARVEKLHRLVGPEIRAAVISRPRLGQRLQHPVRKLGGREYFVV
jgi:hypothetical protein